MPNKIQNKARRYLYNMKYKARKANKGDEEE